MNKKPLFSEEIYRNRIRRVKERMDHAGMELLLVTDPANMNYLTGYDGWSFYVHQGVVVDLAADTPFWFGREQDANGARLVDGTNLVNWVKTIKGAEEIVLMHEAARICERVMQTAVEAIGVGVAEEVEARWREAIAHTGVVKPSRVGYSYGLNYVPDWGSTR